METFWILKQWTDYLIRSRKFLPFPSTWVHPSLFGEVCVARRFLCCPIMCLYFLNFVLWCPLQFPYKTMFDSSLPPVVCLCIVVSIIYCVFLFYLSLSCVLCTQCCQFLWIVHFWFPHGYSLRFIECIELIHVSNTDITHWYLFTCKTFRA